MAESKAEVDATQLVSDQNLGDLLLAQGLLDTPRVIEGERLSRDWNTALADVVLAMGWVPPHQFYHGIARAYDLDFVDLRAEPPDPALSLQSDLDQYSRLLMVPWRRYFGRVIVATAEPGAEMLLFARERFGPDVMLIMVSKFDLLWALQKQFDPLMSDAAVLKLAKADPKSSARIVFTIPQVVTFYLAVSLFLGGLALVPVWTLILLNIGISIFYLGNFALRGLLVWTGAGSGVDLKVRDGEVRALDDREMPVFTVLVPMFREPEVLPILANALRKMDYPRAKLDIKLVLEATDDLTINAAKALGLEGNFEIIRVPPSQPQTKPKACNYALHFARGDFLVIFDAEDKPEPDQLKKVIAAFRKAPDNTACIQARLNYFNADENWLTRMFTLDYSMWFDYMLPGLERLGIPIPLGGTSNHFKIEVLRELHAWDPFNVTEDADLGLRLTQKGYRVGVVNSTTFEEANVSIPNWIRQRSRWIKGYMQTWLVHMRNPVKLWQSVGAVGFFGFQFFIGGTLLSGLLNPVFWGLFTYWAFTWTNALDPYFPTILLYISLLNLLMGNGAFIYLSMLAPVKRGWLHLVPYGLTAFLYWVLISIASYKALWQLLFNPFYWEKTEHGLSSHTKAEVEQALAGGGN